MFPAATEQCVCASSGVSGKTTRTGAPLSSSARSGGKYEPFRRIVNHGDAEELPENAWEVNLNGARVKLRVGIYGLWDVQMRDNSTYGKGLYILQLSLGERALN